MRTHKQKEKGVYEVLDWLEKNRPQDIQQFWHCVFEDHILKLYPTLRVLRNSLIGSTIEPPDVKKATEEKSEGKAETGKEGNYKRKRSKDDRRSEDCDDPGSSFASTPSRKKPAKKSLL
ncbi:hypothetical protein M9458_006825, partial [Cirrhinus mrigala]